MNHNFNFENGEKLTKMGASWFTSYCYYMHKDNNHLNWKKSKTSQSRKSTFNNSKLYHNSYLNEIITMNDNRLAQNKINLSGEQVRKMAEELIDLSEQKKTIKTVLKSQSK